MNIMEIFIFGLRYLYHRIFSGFYHLGWRVAFNKGTVIKNAKYISLGNNVYLGKNSFLQVPREHISHNSSKPKLIIEDDVSVNIGTMISAVKSIHIKKGVGIAQYCFIGDHDHDYKNISKPIRHQPLANVAPIIINEGTWIANKVTVCSGVTIGKHCVIGANSVVTKDIPDYSVAVGAPAKVIKKYNFKTKKWERINS